MNYELRIKNIIKNERGTALFMALMILSGVLIVSLSAADLLISGIRQGRTQAYSAKAFFAAEAGAERILWEIRKNGADFNSCNADDYINFTSPVSCDSVYNPTIHDNYLSNDAFYYVIFKSGGVATSTSSVGNYQDAKRGVEVSY